MRCLVPVLLATACGLLATPAAQAAPKEVCLRNEAPLVVRGTITVTHAPSGTALITMPTGDILAGGQRCLRADEDNTVAFEVEALSLFHWRNICSVKGLGVRNGMVYVVTAGLNGSCSRR